MISVKRERPKHKYSGEVWKTNKTNKKYLAIDFHRRCAYCDDHDFYCGGKKSFHVEHFIPKEKFPKYEFVYENLLYSCPYCNTAKSDTWPSDEPGINIVGDKGFANPCSSDYDIHLERQENGKIGAITDLGKYMIKELKLYLRRHELFYMLDQVDERRKKFEEAIKAEELAGHDTTLKRSVLSDINNDFFAYYSAWQSLDDDESE